MTGLAAKAALKEGGLTQAESSALPLGGTAACTSGSDIVDVAHPPGGRELRRATSHGQTAAPR
jgi:hypothetical protein